MVRIIVACGFASLAFLALPVFAQTFDSGSTGVDGQFEPVSSTTLELPANGVFHFTTVNIPAGVTVTVLRNTANTPVTILASGNIAIAGTIDVSGFPGSPAVLGGSHLGPNVNAGPGGYNGGHAVNGTMGAAAGGGLGPGGGVGGELVSFPRGGGGGGHANPGGTATSSAAGGPAYGTSTLLPLAGGSGGGGVRPPVTAEAAAAAEAALS